MEYQDQKSVIFKEIMQQAVNKEARADLKSSIII